MELKLNDKYMLTIKEAAAYYGIGMKLLRRCAENEGCYIPFDWQKDFDAEYLEHIKYYCLVMSEGYIRNHFDDIKGYANVIEQRLDDDGCTMESVLEDNAK